MGAIPIREQTAFEELLNAVSAALGLGALLVAVPLLLWWSGHRGDVLDQVAAGMFGATAILLYLASTAYHACPPSRTKQILRLADHASIYLLIAGTYTPFALGPLRGPLGWSVFGVIWALAAIGIGLKLTTGFRHRGLSLVLYLGMGWISVLLAGPFVTRVPWPGLLWLVLGGLAYTAGAFFYRAKHRKFTHLVWHLFVLVGTSCHFAAVCWYS